MKSTYKPYETEEWFDYFFYRPLANIVVNIFKNTKITPNMLSFISMIFAMLSGGSIFLGIYYKNYLYNLLSAIFLLLHNVFDCADGQLARLKKSTSTFGRIFDGVMDNISYIFLYIGLALGLYMRYHTPFIWIIGIIAGISTSLHCLFFDYYRNQYINIVYKNIFYDNEIIDYTPTNIIEKIFFKFYYSYSKRQNSLINSKVYESIKNYKDTEKAKIIFRKYMKKSIRIWSLIGSTMHITILLIWILLNKPEYFFWIKAFPMNIIFIFAYFFQRQMETKLKKSLH